MADVASEGGRGMRAAGADIDPKHLLTQEAVDSFDVFDDDGDVIDAEELKRVEEEAKQEGKNPPEDAGLPPFDFEASKKEYDALGNKLGRAERGDFDKEGEYDGLYDGDYPDDFLDLPKGAKGIKPDGDWESGWDEERFEQSDHGMKKDSTLVLIDPHILCTPAIADLDGDGIDELVLAVTYFFDKEYYDDPKHSGELAGADPTKYVAGAIVVFDLHSKTLKWQQHLDLSTDTTTFRAYMYSSPTLVDIDADGKLEVVVGTSMGFLYVLGADGRCRENWPVQMGEIQGQPLVADLNGDGDIEIFAADNRGSVALFDKDGRELWERHLRSMISQAAVAGDINGDGELEIVVGSASGHIWALAGDTGEDVKNFPYRTHGKVNAPVLITRLAAGLSQQLAVMSFDGHLYIVDGRTGCADKIDIGESSYSMVLADDLDGNGRMDLVVATMNGVVYCFETPADYHPLKAWPQQVQGVNGMVARHDYYGVYATASSRRPRDIAGDKLAIKIEVVDKRPFVWSNGTRLGAKSGPYNVSIVLKGVGVQEMGQGPTPVIGVADKMDKPGSYVLEVPCPRTRTTATLHVEMQDAHGMVFVDEFPLSFHMHFHKLLKWFITLPLALMVALVLMIKRDAPEDLPLPSYHHNRD